ncbi:GNAT family N-acetyltransferase [Parasediminibacterium sp. JCM 36343]|uniref:GNAT family N-acetyltransferase n=1 Tax=Parasediminibacterium sp. JCM 36343 TaxID=3374279 RepID=UPI00397C21C9
MEHYEVKNNNLLINTNPALLDIALIYKFLSQESYWAKGIPLATVQTSINNSLCFGVYDGDKQIGFARVITDRAVFAYLADVFIVEKHRGKGLSKWLVQSIHAHPDLQGLRRWMLATHDAHGLYKQFGWAEVSDEQNKRMMQKHNPDVYRL